MAKRNIQLRPLAEEDLEDIYLYSQQEFGRARAVKYIHDLDSAFNKLAENPDLARRADYIRQGIFIFQVVSHIVFFRATKSDITVIRVLHKSMDYQRHI